MNRPDITVALFTCHRPWMLGDALASLDQLTADEGTSFEILVVDNASQESTCQLVTQFASGAQHPVRLVCEEKPGLSCARNRAIFEARGEWIAFFDDDQLAERDWLRAMYRLASEKNSRLIGGTLRLRLPENDNRQLGPVARNLLGEFVGGISPTRYTRTFVPGFGHVLVHGSVFDEIGGFDEQIVAGGEDSDVYNRTCAAGIESWYCPSAVAYHVIPAHRLEDRYMRWTALRQGAFIPGRDRSACGVLYPACLLARIGQMCIAHVSRLAWHWLRRDPAAVFDSRCRLWRSEGYLRQALRDVLPRMFAQQDFFASLNFREGRQRLATSDA